MMFLTVVCSDWSWVEKYFKSKQSCMSDKSSEHAAEFRKVGNKHFQKKDFKLALQYYNQVVYFFAACIYYLGKQF